MRPVGDYIRERRDTVIPRIRALTAKATEHVRRVYALMWHRLYWVQYRLSRFRVLHGTASLSAVMLLLMGPSTYWAPTLQGALESQFSTEPRLEGLRSLILTVGGALIGAAAIAFALVMFAMQINVDRMPHGLFRRLSSDARLLGAFTCTFVLAIAIATLSQLSGKMSLSISVLGAGWGTVLILFLFLYAYRRALSLISPGQQLNFLLAGARREMRKWDRRARRAAPLLEHQDESESDEEPSLRSSHDLARVAYFQANPHWTAGAKQATSHAISFARRYAEQGDHEVSGSALNALFSINAAYVHAKGKTFFANHLMFDNPLATDQFINETLEHLRQNVQIGVSRGDEQQIEQTLQAMAALVGLYLTIDYSNELASKTHANLAAGYLAGAVQSIVRHDMADVVMEGVRLMGTSAQLFLAHGEPNDMTVLADKIALVACAGIANEDYRPITLTGMEQLATLTFDLIRTKRRDIRYSTGRLKANVSMVAKMFLSVPDSPISNIHSTYLGPYYSGTSAEALPARLAKLANALLQAKPDNEAAKSIIRNFEEWAEDLHRTEQELLLAAVEKRSHFTFDVVHWIANVTEILLAVSNGPACEEYTRDKLRERALWLVFALSRVPDDADTALFVENLGMTSTLFDAAVDAHNRGCDEVSESIQDILLEWAFKAGKHHTGWAILERSLYGSAALTLASGRSKEELKIAISKRLAEGGAPDQEIRDRTARNIRERAETLYREGHWSSSIEIAMGQFPSETLRPFLEDIANLLSPHTAAELSDSDIL